MLELKEISKSFGEKRVLDKLSFSFPDSETSVIMGQSGCGKTTLLRIIMGLEKPDGGKLELDCEKLSAVFQEDRLADDFSAVRNVIYAASTTREKAEGLLTRLGLGESMYMPVRELSGGMKRRVAIARALLADFDLLVMDEPLKGLDAETKRAVIGIIRELCENKSVIVVTHDENEASSLMTTNGAKLIFDGGADEQE